jgi:peptidase C39-like protein
MPVETVSKKTPQLFQAVTNDSPAARTASAPPKKQVSQVGTTHFSSDGFEGATALRGPQLSALTATAALGSVEDTAKSIVQNSYRQVLMREADPGGLDTWQRQAADLLRQGYSPDFARRAVDNSLRNSDEYQVLSTVQGAFQSVLGRTPNARGFWHERAEQWRAEGASIEDIRGRLEAEFRNSDEYQLNHLDDMINNVYRSELQRDADPVGMQHFRSEAEQMKKAGWGPADILNAITQEIRQSPEYHDKFHGWEGRVPLINQLAPSGDDGSYFNSQANCGPTSMAMVARAVGYGNNLTDAQLIMDMYNKCGTQGGNGTPVDGIAQGANAIGLDATTYSSSAGVEKMAEEIRNGKMVVANGDYYALPAPGRWNNADGGHYVVVTGMDGAGNFLVNDPAGGLKLTLTPQQMAQYLRENPNGGYFTAVGPR